MPRAHFRSPLHGRLFSRRSDLEPGPAASRISAYIYGNILMLTALVPLPVDRTELGIAVLMGTALSTFIAHAFAETVGDSVREGTDITRQMRVSELRNSVPILTSAVLPSAVLVFGAFEVVDDETAQLIAEILVLLRIGGIAFVINRLRDRPVGFETVVASIVIGTVALAVVAVKIALAY
ncbi:hypothetical protein OG921_19810 [Aldersonia sp. NBC_00410]|nr:hypothetical protein [Aldersonia sp. NBC_00410]